MSTFGRIDSSSLFAAMGKRLGDFIDNPIDTASNFLNRPVTGKVSPLIKAQPRGALTNEMLEQIYGTAEQFTKTYQEFTETYYATIGDVRNLKKGVKVDVELEKSLRNIDLKILNAEKQAELYKHYTERVLRLPDLLRVGGLPAVRMPNSNNFSHPLMYLTALEQSGMHPAKVLLQKTNLFFNQNKLGIDSLGVGRSNLLHPSQIQQAMRLEAGPNGLAKFFEGLKNGAKVATLDVETTGVFNFSQVRSMAIATQVYEDGVLSDPVVRSAYFNSPQLGGIFVGGPNGQSQKLSEVIAKLQQGTSGSAAEFSDIITEFESFFKDLNKSDIVMGHNIRFDLRKLVTTMYQTTGFDSEAAAGLRQEMATFFRASDDKVYDTLDLARMYLSDQARALSETGSFLPMEMDKSEKYMRALFSEEVLAKVHIGGAATPFSMENIALNTNLFQLLEKEKQAPEIFKLITKGSHIEETDTTLQSYVLKYILEGKLKLAGLLDEDEKVFSNLVRFARGRVANASALTRTTNIADVSQMSDKVFNYVTQNNNLRGVSINISPDLPGLGEIFSDIEQQQGVGIKRSIFGQSKVRSGTLSIDQQGRISFLAPGMEKPRIVENNVESVMGFVNEFLQRARNSQQFTTRVNLGKGVSEQFNPYASAIRSLGINYESASAIDLVSDTLASVQRPAGIEDLPARMMDAFGSVYKEFGSGLTLGDRARLSLGLGSVKDLPFDTGLGGFGRDAAFRVAQKFADIGDPFYFNDPRGRVFSTVIADITDSIGLKLNTGAIQEGFERADLAFSAQPKQMAELGISYFNKQVDSRIFSLLKDTGIDSKLVIPTEIIMKAFDNVSKSPDTLRELGLSVMDDFANDSKRVNLIWNIGEQLNDDEIKSFSEELFRLFSDENELMKIYDVKDLESLPESVTKDLTTFKQMMKSGQPKPGDLDRFQSLVKRFGIVMGYLDDTAGLGETSMSQRLIDSMEKLGIDISNDVLGNFRSSMMRVGSELFLAVTPWMDKNAQRANREAVSSAVGEVIELSSGARKSVITDQYNKIANELGSKFFLGRLVSSINRAKSGEGKLLLSEFYKVNKRKIGLGTALAGLAGLGYYKYKQFKENKLYEETIEQQPYENIRQIDPLAELKFAYNFIPQRQNPLATAGVVGSLDRNRIGHTRMGNDRNDHLFNR